MKQTKDRKLEIKKQPPKSDQKPDSRLHPVFDNIFKTIFPEVFK